ncbi:MAG: alginate lyase family protein [Acidobacterium ailaaui]|nr:alginate lyase family protein [Pseudacidobacterium ailaaui]
MKEKIPQRSRMTYMKKKLQVILSCFLFFFLVGRVYGQVNTRYKGNKELLEGINRYPLFKKSYDRVLHIANQALKQGVIVPIPKDPDGGYTHIVHKRNYMYALDCGIVYHVTGDTAYAAYVRNMLLKYAAMYEKLPFHPARVPNQPAGKIFWQVLNDCVWQVYMIQAYQYIESYLTPSQKQEIEQHLFTPVVHFLMVDNRKVFDMIHNHGTWCDAAVGITGYVLHRPDWVKKALYGSNEDGKTGYLAQINDLFSPDGYYTEGPYYERYALMPFMVFAMKIQEFQPSMNIFAYRDSVLIKAVHTAIQLTYNKHFFPINDAIKDKTYITDEMVYAVDIAYAYGHHLNDLLSIAEDQGSVIVSDIGLKTAKAIAEGLAVPFHYKTEWFSDGPEGNQGGIAVLRYINKNNNFCAVLKATKLGMGHGHFDKLNLLVYDNGHEIIPDYGAARFINIEPKDGGRYLPENKTWAKQTIAHNTVAVDEKSDYNGSTKAGFDKYSYLVYFKKYNDNLQVVSCADTTAYPGVKLQRTLLLIKPENELHPFLVDVYTMHSNKHHRYDLSYYYKGFVIGSNFKIQRILQCLMPFGSSNGYQYLWKTGYGVFDMNATNQITILNHQRFYTITAAPNTISSINFVMTGSNDPQWDLLTQDGVIFTDSASNHLFLNIIEPHGAVNSIEETVSNPDSNVKSIKVLSFHKDEVHFLIDYASHRYDITIRLNDKNNFITIKQQ